MVPAPPGSSPLTTAEAKKVWQKYPDTRKEIVKIIEAGWEVVAETKHYRAYCPCPSDVGSHFQISGTPGKDGTWANRVRDSGAMCPKKHEILRAWKRGPGVPPA